MLLKDEIVAGEIYVEDKGDMFLYQDIVPALYQIIQMPEVKRVHDFLMFGSDHTEETNPIWENIMTGEIVT